MDFTWLDLPIELFGEIASFDSTEGGGVARSMLAVCSKALYQRLGSSLVLVDDILEYSAANGTVLFTPSYSHFSYLLFMNPN
jgi:hypothetical protein